MIHYYRLIFCLSTILVFTPPPTYAGNGFPPAVGARAVSLGYAYTAVRGDVWGMFQNPANMFGLKHAQAGAYVERRFNLKELTYGSAAFATPFSKGRHFAGLEISSFGFDAYRENKVGISYATHFFDRVSIGIKANYSSINIRDYGSADQLYLDVGLNTIVSDQISLGFSAINVNRAHINTLNGKEEIPTVFNLGIAYQPGDRVLIVADLQKHINFPLSFRSGIEYVFGEIIAARIGVSTEPLSWNAGFGLMLPQLNVDFAFGYHENLGYSPHLSMSFDFKGKKED